MHRCRWIVRTMKFQRFTAYFLSSECGGGGEEGEEGMGVKGKGGERRRRKERERGGGRGGGWKKEDERGLFTLNLNRLLTTQ